MTHESLSLFSLLLFFVLSHFLVQMACETAASEVNQLVAERPGMPGAGGGGEC